jgi:hypothetical protein
MRENAKNSAMRAHKTPMRTRTPLYTERNACFLQGGTRDEHENETTGFSN